MCLPNSWTKLAVAVAYLFALPPWSFVRSISIDYLLAHFLVDSIKVFVNIHQEGWKIIGDGFKPKRASIWYLFLPFLLFRTRPIGKSPKVACTASMIDEHFSSGKLHFVANTRYTHSYFYTHIPRHSPPWTVCCREGVFHFQSESRATHKEGFAIRTSVRYQQFPSSKAV